MFAVTQVTSTATTTDSLKARIQQATQNGTLIKLGLLKKSKSDELMDDRTEKPLFALNEEHSNSSLKTTIQNQNCRWDPDHS